jgi:hypothetical protein
LLAFVAALIAAPLFAKAVHAFAKSHRELQQNIHAVARKARVTASAAAPAPSSLRICSAMLAAAVE